MRDLMFARLLTLWDRLRTSLWALPLLMAAIGAALAFAMLRAHLPWAQEVAWLYGGDAAQARAFAAALIGAMITLSTLAISITMVVLTLAAQQLGPRLIQIFMSDASTKLSLGLFLGTVVYLLLVLRTIDGNASATPSLAITLGTTLVLASVITLLFFVHSLARSIVSDNVIARVGAALDEAILRAFDEEPRSDEAEPPLENAALRLNHCGYVQRIDYHALARAGRKHKARVRLNFRAGAHLIDGEPHAWTDNARADMQEALRRAVVIAPQRDVGQDPEWSAQQLVEVGLRALSPGINDPFTAIAVIDRLSIALAHILRRHAHPGVWRDSADEARVFGPVSCFETMIAAAFDPLREAAAGKAAVLRQIADNLNALAAIAREDHAPTLQRQLALLGSVVSRSIEEAPERDDILKIVTEARGACS